MCSYPSNFPSNNDLYKHLISFAPDGTFTRHDASLCIPTPPKPIYPVLFKDVTISPSNLTWARIFLPRNLLSFTPTHKLPLIFYFHGGGFVLFSPSTGYFHDFCSSLALHLPAVVVSVSYRLAPEHPLPAAYDDAVDAFRWIKDSDDTWLRKCADYSSCFIMGSCSGGNITYHAGLRVAEAIGDFEHLKIKGVILHQPFFGGVEKTESEKSILDDPILPPGITDFMWSQSLTMGADRDNEYSNPTVGGGSKLLERVKLMGWTVMVTGFEGDPLIDRQIGMVKLMEKWGVKVEGKFKGGGHHGLEIMDKSKEEELFFTVKDFIQSLLLPAA